MKVIRALMVPGILIAVSACSTLRTPTFADDMGVIRGYSLGEFDWIIPHQVNGFIGELLADRYPETRDKVFVTADRLGNLGSAAIWVSFDELRRSGKLASGQRVLILGAEASKYLYGGFVYTH